MEHRGAGADERHGAVCGLSDLEPAAGERSLRPDPVSDRGDEHPGGVHGHGLQLWPDEGERRGGNPKRRVSEAAGHRDGGIGALHAGGEPDQRNGNEPGRDGLSDAADGGHHVAVLRGCGIPAEPELQGLLPVLSGDQRRIWHRHRAVSGHGAVAADAAAGGSRGHPDGGPAGPGAAA